MKLTIHLFRDDVKSFDELIQTKYLDGDDAYGELSPSTPLPFECRAFVQSNRTKEPRWIDFLSTHFAIDDLGLHTASSSFVILLKAKERIFAVTFGYAFNALSRGKLEPRFGLRVALNSLDDSQLRTVDTRNIDLVTRQQRTQLNVGSRVTEFGLNPDVDWIRYVAGKSGLSELGKSVSGSESLGITCDCTLDQLGQKCAELLDVFLREDYKTKFPFVDHFQPLPKDDPLLPSLEEEVTKRLNERSHDHIAIAHPELYDSDRLSFHKVAYKKVRDQFEEITLDEIYGFLDRSGFDSVDPYEFYLVGVDDQDQAVTHRRPLYDYLVCEIQRSGQTFVLSLGQWFKIDTDYVQSVNQRAAQISDLTSTLELPPIRKGELEGEYNRRVADERDWLLLDRALFTVTGNQKVEVCDVLTPAPYFLCVKKMSSSATLSHLFAQASVSATLLRESADYRAGLHSQIGTKWPDAKVDPIHAETTTFVYVIPTQKEGPLPKCMFFFSLMNLLEHTQIIRRTGFNVALCKVDYTA